MSYIYLHGRTSQVVIVREDGNVKIEKFSKENLAVTGKRSTFAAPNR